MKTNFAFIHVLVVGALAAAATAGAAEASTPLEPTPAQIEARLQAAVAMLKRQTGAVTIGDGLATIKVPEGQSYLDPVSARIVLEDLWGNPEGAGTLGMLMPAEVDPRADAAWGVIFTYEDSGHVKDDDAAGINYDKLLGEMKSTTAQASEEREKRGYPPIELVGWAASPRYDQAAKKLYWAKELKFAGSPANTLNYNIRVLGRKGVLNLNAVGSMAQLAQIEADTPGILAAVDFNSGNRYADFNESTDHVAEYGIAALIAGGIAAKTGLLKLIWIAIIAGKKFIIIGVIAIGAWIARLVKGRKQSAFHETLPPS